MVFAHFRSLESYHDRLPNRHRCGVQKVSRFFGLPIEGHDW